VPSTIENLKERRFECWKKATALADLAFEEQREMSGEEQRQFDEWDAEMVKLDERCQALLAGEKRAKALEDTVAEIRGRPAAPQGAQLATRGDWQPQVPTTVSYEQELEELRRFVMGETRTYDVPMPSVVERRTLQVSGVAMPTSFICLFG
jgi:hypothetical protein